MCGRLDHPAHLHLSLGAGHRRPRAPRLVIWDFDGTIADTRAVILGTFAQVFSELGLGECDLVAARASIGLPLATAFSRLAGTGDPEMLAGLVAHYRRVFAVRAPVEATMFPGVGEVLAACSERGLPCAITTSRGRASLEPMLDRFAIATQFVSVVTDDEVAHPKPHPEMVEVVGGATGIDASDSLLVGDTSFDIEMGRRAGTATCGVTWGNQSVGELTRARPDHLVERPGELTALLGG